ncbi:hypothetical protein CRG98_012274 [Punica granatum]|uniref:Uncharacterized protein n=1 Tax=Punica granatum TaxID=22663 RepID=A0A2I0KFP8_PUNGR|nr:hypothetical protein CRG98_012274 [Punica granatum]
MAEAADLEGVEVDRVAAAVAVAVAVVARPMKWRAFLSREEMLGHRFIEMGMGWMAG